MIHAHSMIVWAPEGRDISGLCLAKDISSKVNEIKKCHAKILPSAVSVLSAIFLAACLILHQSLNLQIPRDPGSKFAVVGMG